MQWHSRVHGNLQLSCWDRARRPDSLQPEGRVDLSSRLILLFWCFGFLGETGRGGNPCSLQPCQTQTSGHVTIRGWLSLSHWPEQAEVQGSDVSERHVAVSESGDVVWMEGHGNKSNSLDVLNVEAIEELLFVYRKTQSAIAETCAGTFWAKWCLVQIIFSEDKLKINLRSCWGMD